MEKTKTNKTIATDLIYLVQQNNATKKRARGATA